MDSHKARTPRHKRIKELGGDGLSRPPKGFPKDHPADRWLRKKQWVYYEKNLDPKMALSGRIVNEAAGRFEAMAPVMDFLTRPLLGRARRSDFF